MATLRILVTGFEPFGGDSVNPSWLVAQQLAQMPFAGAQVQALELTCEFWASTQALVQALTQQSPDVVLALGLAQGREGISIERVAINVDDARIPDNAGRQPIDSPVVAGGQAAYFSTLLIKRFAQGLQRAGYPAHISQTAGTFVCNHVFRFATPLARPACHEWLCPFAGLARASQQCHRPQVAVHGAEGASCGDAAVVAAVLGSHQWGPERCACERRAIHRQLARAFRCGSVSDAKVFDAVPALGCVRQRRQPRCPN